MEGPQATAAETELTALAAPLAELHLLDLWMTHHGEFAQCELLGSRAADGARALIPHWQPHLHVPLLRLQAELCVRVYVCGDTVSCAHCW